MDTNHPAQNNLTRALILELDYTVLNGHQILQDIFTKRLADEGIDLTTFDAARYLDGRPFAAGIGALCEAKGKQMVDAPTVATECQTAFSAAMDTAIASLPKAALDGVSELLKKSFGKVIVLSCASEAALQTAFASVVSPDLLLVHENATIYGSTAWETLRRVCRKNSLIERLIAILVGSGYSVKSAITAGMGVLARVNPIVEYQDFTGADALVSEFNVETANELFRLLRISNT